MTTAQLEKRVAILEAEVLRLKANERPRTGEGIGSGPIHNKEWLEKIWGSFADDPAFDEAMRYGREWREAQRPGKPKSRKLKKGTGTRTRK